jgi:ABC-2 type transport system permease protein
MLVAIVGGLLLGELIVSDFETKSVHNEIISGKSRLGLIIAKLISFAIQLTFVMIPYAVVVLIGIGSGNDFAPLNGVPSAFFNLLADGSAMDDPDVMKAFALCLVIFFVYIAKISICFPLAFKCRKKIPVLVLSFSTSFVFDIIRSITKDVDGLSDFVESLPYYQITKITMDASTEDIIGALVSSVIFIVVMILITHFAFRKLEIK